MKATLCLLAASLVLLPAWGTAAAKADIDAAMTAQEQHESTASADRARTNISDEERAIDEELDELGDAPIGSDDAADTRHPADERGMKTDAAEQSDAAQTGGHGIGTDSSTPTDSASADAAYGVATAIAPVTLADGDWAFIEGDERRGWFFDRSRMMRNEDGTLSYWQLILYNDLGRDQFVRAMHDDLYQNVAYTLQRRVLDTKKNTIRTYEIIAYDDANTVITDGDRDGHAAEICPHTMAEKERDAVKKAAKKLKLKK